MEGINTFKWTVTKAGCNAVEDIVNITYKNITIANAGEDISLCNNTFALNGNTVKSGETGKWTVVSGAGIFADQYNPVTVVSGLSNGENTFKWTVSDNGSTCASTESDVTLSVSNLAITENSNERVNPSCFGASDGSITVSAIGGNPFLTGLDYKFTLNGEEQFADVGSPVIFNNLSVGVYTVDVTDGAGCLKSTSIISLTSPDQILISDTKTPISCFGETDGAIEISTTNGNGSLSYEWRKTPSSEIISTNQNISDLNEGIYEVTVTDVNGCTNTKEVVITQPFALTASANLSDFNRLNISCNGNNDGYINLEVFNGTGPYTYLWDNGSTNKNRINLAAGTYSVVITDANNCSTSQSFTLEEPQPLTINPTGINPISCFGQADGIAVINTAGGSPNQLYSLNGIDYQESNIFRGLDAGTYEAFIKVGENCEESTNFSIVEPNLLSAVISDQNNATCEDAIGSATVSAAGGTGNLSYTWRNSMGQFIGSGPSVNNLPGGVYNVLVSDENGCAVEAFANINSADGAAVSTNNIGATSCFNSEDGSATIGVTGNSPFEIYWANGEDGLSATRLKAGLNTVTIIDNAGCVVVETVNIPSPNAITYDVISSVRPSCHNGENGKLEVQAAGGAGGYSYSWSNGNTSNKLTDIGEGEYTLTITDTNGCELTETIFLYAPDPISYTVTDSAPPTCKNTNDAHITIQAKGGTAPYNYVWSTNITGPTLENVSGGNYEVTITDSRGCQNTEEITIANTSALQIDFESEVNICTGSSYLAAYNRNDAVSYDWKYEGQTISREKELYVDEAGVYSLTVANASGCVAENSFALSFSDDLLSADFVMATEAYVNDTIILVDISWPVPEAVSWIYDDPNIIVLEENADYLSLVFADTGTYALGINIDLAQCKDYYEKTIKILPHSSKEDASARNNNAKPELITKFNVFPNPAIGDFNIMVELDEKADINLRMINLKGNEIKINEKFKHAKSYNMVVKRQDVAPGVYIIELNASGHHAYQRVIIR